VARARCREPLPDKRVEDLDGLRSIISEYMGGRSMPEIDGVAALYFNYHAMLTALCLWVVWGELRREIRTHHRTVLGDIQEEE